MKFSYIMANIVLVLLFFIFGEVIFFYELWQHFHFFFSFFKFFLGDVWYGESIQIKENTNIFSDGRKEKWRDSKC